MQRIVAALRRHQLFRRAQFRLLIVQLLLFVTTLPGGWNGTWAASFSVTLIAWQSKMSIHWF